MQAVFVLRLVLHGLRFVAGTCLWFVASAGDVFRACFKHWLGQVFPVLDDGLVVWLAKL